MIHPYAYALGHYWSICRKWAAILENSQNGPFTPEFLAPMLTELPKLSICASRAHLRSVPPMVDRILANATTDTEHALGIRLGELGDRIQDELKAIKFYCVPPALETLYESPRERWGDVP